MGGLVVISFIISLICSLVSGSSDEVNEAILSSPQAATQLCLTLMGAMAFWGGVMKIAEKSGLVKILAKLFKPLLKRAFKDVDPNGEAFGAIVMNISANLLGLGNAATPLGIKAIKALAKEQNAGKSATKSIITLVVINTASIQLLPTTVATLRQAHGSNQPMAILLPVIVTSAIALSMGLMAISVCDKLGKLSGKAGNKE